MTPEYALERARRAEREIAQGNYLGPLHGIPYNLKDLIDTEGIRTTYGYRSHQDYVPEHSATVHSRLEQAGGVLVGKAHCHYERAWHVPVDCFNPWDLARSPGVSSSGSGASVAASMCLASIGSDTAGSVRKPAAWSGVVGLKATFGLVSRHNAFGPSWSYDQLGPLAKTVEDTAIVLQAVAGHDPNDPVSLLDQVPDYRHKLEEGIEGIRVGVLEEFVGSNCTEEVEEATRKAITVLGELGADLTEVSIPHVGKFLDVWRVIAIAEAVVNYPEAFPKERLDNIDPDVQEWLEQGREHTLEQYIQAQRAAAVIRQDVGRVLKKVDVVVGPTMPTPPLLISETVLPTASIRSREVSYPSLVSGSNLIASVTGLPALSVPCGFARGSLPIGLHLMGRPLEEPLLLRMGYAYEQATEWHLRHPDIH